MYLTTMLVALQLGSIPDLKPLAASIIAVELAKRPNPAPSPAPPKTEICDNCNGTGKLGDGTVFVKCPECDGTGKKKTQTNYVEYCPTCQPSIFRLRLFNW